MIHLIPATGLILAVFLVVGFAIVSLTPAKPSPPTLIEQQCIEQGVEPELSSKCEHPFS